jgi:hypothetical protein
MFFGWGDCISFRPARNASRFDLPSGEVKRNPGPHFPPFGPLPKYFRKSLSGDSTTVEFPVSASW